MKYFIMSTNFDTTGSKTAGKGDMKTEKVSFKLPEKMSTNDEISKQSLQGNQQGNRRRAWDQAVFNTVLGKLNFGWA
jgi:hypothetical protein